MKKERGGVFASVGFGRRSEKEGGVAKTKNGNRAAKEKPATIVETCSAHEVDPGRGGVGNGEGSS